MSDEGIVDLIHAANSSSTGDLTRSLRGKTIIAAGVLVLVAGCGSSAVTGSMGTPTNSPAPFTAEPLPTDPMTTAPVRVAVAVLKALNAA